jgi:flagellar brake protein
MFEDTRPAELSASGEEDAWAAFRVGHPQERLRLLRELRDGAVPVLLGGPDGATLATTLWALDDQAQRLGFLVEPSSLALQALVEADEAVAVAYLDSVKLQFELGGLVLVRGAQASTLQSALPPEIYRFQRRSAYRVRPGGRQSPVARLRHPSIPEMALALRVVPPLQAGTRIGELLVELDHETRFTAAATLQHVTGHGEADRGVRIGCEWQQLGGPAARTLQRWIDQMQKRRRLLSLG